MKRHYLFYALTAVYLTFAWLSTSHLFARAEEGIVFYSLSRELKNSLFIWQEANTGYLDPTVYAKIPLLIVLNIPNLLFGRIFTQHLFFLFIFFTGQASAYLLTFHFTKDKKIAFYSGLFYLFNLYTMTQVFSRSLYVGMLNWSLLPLFLFIWYKYIESGKNLLYFFLFIFVFSYIFSAPATILTFGGITMLITLYLFINDRNVNVIKRSLLGWIGWICISSYWLYPFLTKSQTTFSEQAELNLNFQSISEVSVYFPLDQIILLKQKYFFDLLLNPQAQFGDYYTSFVLTLTSLLVFSLVLVGIFTSRKKLGKYYGFTLLAFLVIIFLIKGTNPPFGEIFYSNLFKYVKFAVVYRNPYEKLGALFLIFYSIFFALGLSYVLNKMNLIKKIVLLSLIFIVLVLPMWNGKVFVDGSNIKVPDYYQDVDEYLSKDVSDGRILVLPALAYHVVKNKWGYYGDESSRFYFSKPAVSKNLKINNYWDKYRAIFEGTRDKQDITKALSDLNIKYIILDRSVDWVPIGSQSTDELRDYLENIDQIEYLDSFGELDIFEYTDYTSQSLFALAEGSGDLYYEKISPVHYKVHVKSNDRHKIIFKTTFNKFWMASINGQKVNEHEVSLGYANSWNIIEPNNYVLDVKFEVWPWE